MSLDVSLIREKWVSYDEGKTHTTENETLYDANITHNLGVMARQAGLYEALWRPYQLRDDYNIPEGDHTAEYDFEDRTVITAKEIIPVIEKGLADLKARPKFFKTFDSENGWGLYIHFVPFVKKYLEACKMYPDAIVRVCR